MKDFDSVIGAVGGMVECAWEAIKKNQIDNAAKDGRCAPFALVQDLMTDVRLRGYSNPTYWLIIDCDDDSQLKVCGRDLTDILDAMHDAREEYGGVMPKPSAVMAVAVRGRIWPRIVGLAFHPQPGDDFHHATAEGRRRARRRVLPELKIPQEG